MTMTLARRKTWSFNISRMSRTSLCTFEQISENGSLYSGSS